MGKELARGDLRIDVSCGRDYPDPLREYKLIIHCCGCMPARKEMPIRIQKAKETKVPVTNYGLFISFSQGVIQRVLSPFPAALAAFQGEMESIRKTGKSERRPAA